MCQSLISLRIKLCYHLRNLELVFSVLQLEQQEHILGLFSLNTRLLLSRQRITGPRPTRFWLKICEIMSHLFVSFYKEKIILLLDVMKQDWLLTNASEPCPLT